MIWQEKIILIHCFGTRASWKSLQILKKEFPAAPLLLLSATMCERDVTRIKENLGLNYLQLVRQPQTVRMELTYEVHKKSERGNETMAEIQKIIENARPGRCIIYCATPDKCRKLFESLAQHFDTAGLGIHHGRLEESEKDAVIQRWRNRSCQTMIATSSFGMGIHMPDVRHVVHYIFPISMSKCFSQSRQ